MRVTGDIQSIGFWSKKDFWVHSLILFSVLIYLYSPLFDHALGRHVHARPHNHIPVKLIQHGDHFHIIGDFSHGELETTDDHICSLDFAGLILFGIFVTFIASNSLPIQNVFVYKIEIDWKEIILNGRPPPNPPPRSLSLII